MAKVVSMTVPELTEVRSCLVSPKLEIQHRGNVKQAKGPEEDWTGLKDAKQRKKLQNRLNVRAHSKS